MHGKSFEHFSHNYVSHKILSDFGTMPIFKRTFSQDLDLLEQHLTKEIISQTDCKTTLTKLRTTFENAFNSEIKARMQNYTRYDAQSFYDAMIFNMDSLGKYMLELILHQIELTIVETKEVDANTRRSFKSNSSIESTVLCKYTGIEVQHFRDTLLQHLGNVKKSVAERTRHLRQYERRDRISIVQMTAAGQQHTEQPEIINEGRVDQYPKTCQVKSPMLESSPDNQTTEYSKKSLETVGLRWVPTGKIFTPSTTKVDSEPPNGSNADITNQYESTQTLDVSAVSTEVHQAAKTVTTSNELDLLFGPLFDEYLNGENQVVLKSSAVTTADASDKRQQQPDSTSSTSTLATSVTADGNFDLSYALSWKPCQGDSLNLPDHSTSDQKVKSRYQVKEMDQDNDLKNLSQKDKAAKGKAAQQSVTIKDLGLDIGIFLQQLSLDSNPTTKLQPTDAKMGQNWYRRLYDYLDVKEKSVPLDDLGGVSQDDEFDAYTRQDGRGATVRAKVSGEVMNDANMSVVVHVEETKSAREIMLENKVESLETKVEKLQLDHDKLAVF
ncbi:hypothetical protein Tco_0466096 [Tanacetum coccineum]